MSRVFGARPDLVRDQRHIYFRRRGSHISSWVRDYAARGNKSFDLSPGLARVILSEGPDFRESLPPSFPPSEPSFSGLFTLCLGAVLADRRGRSWVILGRTRKSLPAKLPRALRIFLRYTLRRPMAVSQLLTAEQRRVALRESLREVAPQNSALRLNEAHDLWDRARDSCPPPPLSVIPVIALKLIYTEENIILPLKRATNSASLLWSSDHLQQRMSLSFVENWVGSTECLVTYDRE